MWGDHPSDREPWTKENLVRLFNSVHGPNARGLLRPYEELFECISAGTIRASREVFTCMPRPKGDPRRNRTPEWQLFRRACRGGSDLHGWLKWWGYWWLAEQAGTTPKFEVTLPGYGRADLWSEQTRTVLECGNTSAQHALTALTRRIGTRFVVVPFQRAALENMAEKPVRKLAAFTFTLSAGRADEQLAGADRGPEAQHS